MEHASPISVQTPVMQRQPTFRGQQPGEQVVLLTHPAGALLILPGWFLAASSITLVAIWLERTLGKLNGAGIVTIQMALTCAAVLALAQWLIAAVYPWWCQRMIITNQRVIRQRVGLRMVMDEIPLTTVQSAKVEVRAFGEWLLGYGRVTLTAAGGEPVTFRGVAQPQRFANLVMQTRTRHVPPPENPNARIADPAIRAIIDRLANAQPLPTLAPMAATTVINWPLRHAMTILLEDGETVLGQISRHWWALARRLALPFGLVACSMLLAFVGIWLHVSFGVAALFPGGIGLLWCLLVYLNFVDDGFILTNRRILDVNRRFFVLFEATNAIEYGNIQEVRTTIPGVWARVAKFGTVRINVGGNSAPVIMDHLPRPQQIEAAIEGYRAVIQQRAQVTAVNEERLEMRNWFASVVDEMIVLAPDLRGLSLEAAIESAYATGLRLLVLADAVVIPGMPTGVVVSQSPFPEARALRGGDISVTLSGM